MGISAHFLEITGALRALLKSVRGPYKAPLSPYSNKGTESQSVRCIVRHGVGLSSYAAAAASALIG